MTGCDDERIDAVEERLRIASKSWLVSAHTCDWWCVAFWVVYLTGIILTFITMIYVIIGAL